MIPVKNHIEAVKLAHQKKVETSMVKDLDEIMKFDPRFIASFSRSDIPYEMAKSMDIYSFHRPHAHDRARKHYQAERGYRPTHDCGFPVSHKGEKTLTSKDVIRYWHDYYEKLKAKEEEAKKQEAANVSEAPKSFRQRKEDDLLKELKWDEHTLSLMSKNMQEFITFRLTSKSGNDYHRLSRNFISKFGRPQEMDKIGLIEDLFNEELRSSAKPSKSKWMKDELRRLLPAVSSEPNFEIKEMPDGQMLPTVNAKKKHRRSSKRTEHKLVKASSATDLRENEEKEEVLKRSRSESPRPSYSRELLSGKKQLYSKHRPDRIVFSSGKRFEKKLQPIYPDKSAATPSPTKSMKRKDSKRTGSLPSIRAPSRGHRRWIEAPEYMERKSELTIKLYELEDDERSLTSSAGITSRFSPESSARIVSGRSREGTQSRIENIELAELRAEMTADWRNKWRVTIADSAEPNDLLALLTNLHPFTRIRGIVTVAYIAQGQHSSYDTVPSYLLKAIDCMLRDDPDHSVRKTAALCLSAVAKFSEEAKTILLEVIRAEESDSTDKWAAAQGLAHNQVYTSDVIQVFLRIYVDNYSPDGSDDPRRETALKLLRVISSGTSLVAGMAGELLASSDWGIRQSACNILGACHGPLPADVVAKLSQLMWADWSEAVRVSAAHALGKTGHGLDVHHELVSRLQSKNGADRARALRLISIVGFMTVRLMPLYLNCFRDTYTDVREAACCVAARLYKLAARTKSLLDSAICERLLEILQFDTAPAVRLSAIKAIQNCIVALDLADPPTSTATASLSLFRASPTPNQKLRDKINTCLVWALQTVPESEVRLKSLLILREHGYGDAEFAEILRQRLLAEEHEQVRAELETSLEECLQRVHSASRQLPLLGDLRKNIRDLSNSTSGVVLRLEKIDQKDRLRDFKNKCLAGKSSKKRKNK